MSELELTAAQKAAAVTRVGENIALRSGAGCGKTFVLARRFTELLARLGHQPNPLSELLAVTFTDKAAIEMSQRVRRMLVELLGRSKGADRQKIQQWIYQLPEARISTIHGLCSGLLRQHAVTAGLDPAFGVGDDDLLASALRAQSADQAVLEAVEAADAGAIEALSDLSFEQCVELVQSLLSGRGAIDFSRYFDAAAIQSRWGQLRLDGQQEAATNFAADERVTSAIATLESCPCDDAADKLLSMCQLALSAATQAMRQPDAASMNQLVALGKPGNAGSAKAWGSKEAKKSAADALRALAEAAAQHGVWFEQFTVADDRAALLLSVLCRLASRANEIYAAHKRRRGILDFEDLLIEADALLTRQPQLANDLAGQLHQLLIDEAQDTDSLQLSMLERLARGEGGQGELPPGRLFLVGDAKQSIYRFRGAQVEVFNDLCRRIGRSQSEDLDTSFRTHGQGVAFVNRVFERLMGDQYEPLKSHRAQVPPGPSVELLLATGPGGANIDRQPQATAAQAAATAQHIQAMLSDPTPRVWDRRSQQWRPPQAKDIAILFTRMTVSGAFERELERRGLPYYVLAGAGFFQQQEVLDVLNALQAVDNPRDDLAVVGVLRGSMFGVDDNTLAQLADKGPATWIDALADERLTADLPAGQRRSLRLACDMLTGLHARKDALGIEALARQILRQTGYEATLLSQFQGRRMLGNVRRLIDRARAAQQQGLTLAQFITAMNDLVVSESRHEQAAVAGEQDNVVRLMTVHKAKGLEFPIVVLPDLNAGRRPPTDRLMVRSDWGLTLKLRVDDEDDEETQPLSYRLAKSLETRDERAEDIRLLYVAMTRHEDHLVLVGADWQTKDGRYRNGDSYLGMLDDALALPRLDDQLSETTVPYGEGLGMLVKRVTPQPPPRRQGAMSAGLKLLRTCAGPDELSSALAASADQPPDLAQLGPLAAPLPAETAAADIAVTALADFERCPMLYRWQRQLRVPAWLLSKAATAQPHASGENPPPPPAGPKLDGATLGTVLHAAMERLDFSAPAQPLSLVQAVLADMELDHVEPGPVAQLLDEMLRRFGDHPLWDQIAHAPRVLREMDFVLAGPHATIRGQIDLLYQDAGGAWHIVDYKSDRVGADDIAAHASHYRTQMMIYAMAAARYLDAPPADATLYFLRPGVCHVMPTTGEELAAAQADIDQLTRRLAVARSTGVFDRASPDQSGPACRFCHYRQLCQATDEN